MVAIVKNYLAEKKAEREAERAAHNTARGEGHAADAY